jgi:hypothetical protein
VIDNTHEDDVAAQDERREHDRSRLIVDVYFDGKDATGVASTKDLSLGGFYMNTKTDIPVGTKLMVRIPIGENQQLVAKAEVVYVESGSGVGLRFVNLLDEARELIKGELKNS